MIDIGLYLKTIDGSLVLRIGVIEQIFQTVGTIPSSRERLNNKKIGNVSEVRQLYN